MSNPTNFFETLLANSSTENGISKKLIEEIFLLTLRKDYVPTERAILSLADVIVEDSQNEETMNEELLSHCLFERLMLTDTKKHLIPSPGKSNDEALETRVISYLYRSYVACENARAHSEGAKIQAFVIMRNLIITNASTCMHQLELFDGQSLSTQWLELFEQSVESDSLLQDFLVAIVHQIILDVDGIEALGALKAIFYPMFNELHKQISKANIITLKKNIFDILNYFVRDKRAPQLGEVLIDYTTPNPNAKGGEFMLTLFGQLLSLSIIPKINNGVYEFFEDISFDSNHVDPSLWNCMSNHQNSIFLIFKQLLLMSATTKQKTLQWISNCLISNVQRGFLWSSINMVDNILNQTSSDSFMIGLCAVLLRLCIPLCQPTLKVFLVDPTYCAVIEEDRAKKQVNMVKSNEETCLLPIEDNEIRLTAEKYNFITELFFMTHKAFELSYRVCISKYSQISRDLHRLQNAYQDVMNTNPNDDFSNNLLRMLKEQLQKYLCLRNCLMEPENDAFIVKFFEASSLWLTDIALSTEEEFKLFVEKKDFAPHIRRKFELPLEQKFVPPILKSVPENIVDNIVGYLNFSRHFPPGQFVEMYFSAHDAFFQMIILFMGSSKLVKNPHLRAKLAEGLEFLLPKGISGSIRSSFITHVFDRHVDRLKLVKSLLEIFVSIEMTGQSVQFEQKFNYRRPMYAIMEYLWTKQDQVLCFKNLAKEAEINMEAIEPPLFLRFINLLINDAIFLLDESLSNLQQIRTLQEAQDRGDWESLTPEERQEHQLSLQSLGMMTRFDNILGRDTINILKLLTIEIKSIFCHNSMVDRIASMLNYFLLNLVGPQKEKFKVKDKKEFEFDPAQTVMEICFIYINLSDCDKFCLAVSQDGRSYSANLFKFAENILIRIGGGQLIGEMSEFAARVDKMDVKYKQDQELLVDAPEEYLDPIMSTLMSDPVILPSSNISVDRSTIARHLLSDQTDPFNRAPLTMDKIIPNNVLKEEIEKWILEKRATAEDRSSS